MIPFDFDYYRPDSTDEAIQTYNELNIKGKNPMYYSGGSEIISMARVNNIHPGAVIDLKGIPECNILELDKDNLIIGSCVTLSRISESDMYPLLGKACGRIADHTMQDKITIGGNIAGTIIYRETILPLLLSDSLFIIACDDGLHQVSVSDNFNKRIMLKKGEFIAKIIIPRKLISLPFFHIKKTKNEKIDYPLISVAAVNKNEIIRVAFSGICSYPFRSQQIEQDLNNNYYSPEEKVDNAISHLPDQILNDIYGWSEYRRFILKNTLLNMLQSFKEGAQ